MEQRNIASASWSDHLVFGEGDGRLDTVPALRRRMERWRDEDLTSNYGPVIAGRAVRLYVARQWDERSEAEEAALLSHSAVAGLVFSTFRFDNPGPVARGDWVA